MTETPPTPEKGPTKDLPWAVGMAPEAKERFLQMAAEQRRAEEVLLKAVKENLPRLEELLKKFGNHWGYEDPIYRFYHQSFKVYRLQAGTEEIVAALRALAPDRPLNEWFLKIVSEGTGRKFEVEHNDRWLEITRPILEAFFHARWFLEMACRYGRALEEPPSPLPSGYAGFLYLYDLR